MSNMRFCHCGGMLDARKGQHHCTCPKPWIADDIMPYGKHKGKHLSEVPADYLMFLWGNGLCHKVHTDKVAHFIHQNLRRLQPQPTLQGII